MSEEELNQIEQKIKSELEPFLDGMRRAGARSRNFKIFKKAYHDFERKRESNLVIRDYITRGVLRKTHEIKDIIQWIFVYLGLVESAGNNIANMTVMLLVANGIDFHVERLHGKPRIKHAVSIEDLEKEKVFLGTKLGFIKDNGIRELASIIDSQLRNDIAHLKLKIKGNEIYVKEKPARKLVFDSTLKLLRAINVTRNLLDQLAEERGLLKRNRS